MQPISIKEAKPNDYCKCYLVFCDNLCWYTAYVDIDRDTDEECWFHFAIGSNKVQEKVTHWMPCPPRPDKK